MAGSPSKSATLHLFVISDFFHVGAADDQVGHLEDAEFLLRRAHDGRRQKHLRGANFDAAHHLLVAAELAGVENFDLHFAFERGIGSLGVFIRRNREERAGKADVAEPQCDGLRYRRLSQTRDRVKTKR